MNNKLYTEEQIRSMLNSMGRFIDEQVDDYIDSLTPIELPSDEEIKEAIPYFPDEDSIEFWANSKGFIDGAKYVINKIQGGNK